MQKHHKQILFAVILGIVSLSLRSFRYTFFRSLTIKSFEIAPTLQEEVQDHLGADEFKTYLVALMNTHEKKPDGGFFGSYAIVEIGPKKLSVDFFDSYHPGVQENVKVALPQRFDHVFGHHRIGFLGANMIGFTPIDGKNIHALYEETQTPGCTYGEIQKKNGQDVCFLDANIEVPTDVLDGVVFVKSDIFNLLIPDFTTYERTREFENATIDLQRGYNTGNKKAHYFQGIRSLLSPFSIFALTKRALHHADKIRTGNYIRVYLPNASEQLRGRLGENNLIHTYQDNRLYLFEHNLGFNKIDQFVEKTLCGTDLDGEKYCQNIEQQERVEIQRFDLAKPFMLSYSGNVPLVYQDFIIDLEQKKDITLTARERTILSITPQFSTRGVLHFPPSCTLHHIQGDHIQDDHFSTPFSHARRYDVVAKGKSFQREIQFSLSCER